MELASIFIRKDPTEAKEKSWMEPAFSSGNILWTQLDVPYGIREIAGRREE